MSKEIRKNQVGTSFIIEKEASKAIFVHPPLRKKIIQRCRRMCFDALGAFSYGAFHVSHLQFEVGEAALLEGVGAVAMWHAFRCFN